MTTADTNPARSSKGRIKLFALLLSATAIFAAGRAEAAMHVASISVGAQTGTVCQGSTTTASYTVTISYSGSGSAITTTLSLSSAAPAGTSFSCSGSCNVTSPTTTATINLTTASAVAQSATSFTVQESHDSNTSNGSYTADTKNANAGPDQTVCATTATLAGNTVFGGSGAWTRTAGAGTVTTPSSPTSGVTGLGAGLNTFRWTITPGGGCTGGTTTDDVNITNNSPTTATVGGAQTICALGTTAGLGGNTPSQGSGAWSVVSGGNGTFSPNNLTPNATFTHTTGAGPITLRWTISNPPCTASTADVVITIHQPPTTATVGGTQTICALGTTAGLGGNTPSSGAGTWSVVSGGTGTFNNIHTGNTTFANTGGAGPITLRWTISNPPCADSTADVTVNINAAPVISGVTANQTVCVGGSTSFTVSTSAGTNLTYQWYKGSGIGAPVSNTGDITGATTATLSFSSAVAGDAGQYHVVVSSAGCTSVDSQTSPGLRTLTVNTAPVISGVTPSLNPATICAGSAASFTVATSAGTSLTYQWYKGTGTGSPVANAAGHIAGATTATLSFTNAVTGDSAGYHVVVSNTGCTAADSESFPGLSTLTVNPIPSSTITATPTSVCASSTGNQASVPDAGVGATYAWSITSGGTITSATNVNPITYTANATGPVSIHVTVSANSCSSTGALSVTVNALPAATGTITAGPICLGAKAHLNATGKPSNDSCTWTAIPATGSGVASPLVDASCGNEQITPTSSGTYSYYLNVTDASHEFAPAGVIQPIGSITVENAVSGTGTITGSNAVCSGAAGVAYSVSGYTNATTFTWTAPTGSTIHGNGSAAVTIDFGSTSGNVAVTPSDSCGNGTPASLSVTVSGGLGSTGTISGTSSVCVPQSGVSYSTPTVTNADTYTWSYTGTGATINNQGTNSITIDFASNATGGNLTVTPSSAGCGNGTTSAPYAITVTVCGTKTFLSSSQNPSTHGESVTFYSSVKASGPTPTGSVAFKDGAGTLSTVGLDINGKASYSTSTLEIGTHPITAVYSGGGSYSGSTSDVVHQVVNTDTAACGSFGEPPIQGSSGSPAYDVVTGYLDGGANLDLVVGLDGGFDASLGDGLGNFSVVPSFTSFGSSATHVAVGDFDGDGKLDIAASDSSSGHVAAFLGDGAGNFTIKGSPQNAGTSPSAIAVGDFNGDGKLDVAVANSGSGNVSVLLGNGDGTFGSAASFNTGNGPSSVVVGDVNGDGIPDLIVANSGDNNVSILLGDGTGAFGSATNFPAGSAPVWVAVGDFDGDGNVDLAVANNISSGTVSILLGNGAGSFSAPSPLAAGSHPNSVAVGDFDNDGIPDLAVTNANGVRVFFGTGGGAFGSGFDYATGSVPVAVTIGDFNNDGNNDLAVLDTADNEVYILLNTTPTANASGGTTICPGGSTPLSGSGSGTIGPYTCSWSPATGLDDATSCTPTASPSVSTTYALTVTDGNGCQSTNVAAVDVTLYGSIAVTGNTEFCFDNVGGVASATAPTGGVTNYQWGYRTVSTTGAITDLAGHINSSYTLQGADFPGPGTYYLVCTLYITGTACNSGSGTQTIISNEIPITIDPACLGANPVPPPVQFFTLTTRNGSGTNVLQWFTANFAADATELRARTDGTYPLNEADGTLITSTQPGTANTKVTYTHGGVANGTTYSYSLFEYKGIVGPTLYSGDKDVSGRPFNTPAGVKWSFSSGGITLTSPGVRPTQSPTNGAIYAVSNNRNLDSMNLGPGGGDWPISPSVWTPIAMNAPSQGRAIPVHLKVTSIGGSFNPVFVGATDGRVYAVDGLTGSLLWASPVLGDSITASPAAMFNEVHGGAPDVIMVGANSSAGNKFYGLKISDGTILWTFDHSGANDIGLISGQAFVDYTNNRTYFTSRGGVSGHTVWALNMGAAIPNLIWSADAGDVDSGANLANSTLYVGNNTGQVYALNPATGAFKWTGPWSTGDGPVKNLVWTSGLKLFFW